MTLRNDSGSDSFEESNGQVVSMKLGMRALLFWP